MDRLKVLFLASDVDLSSHAGDSVHVQRLSEELSQNPRCEIKVICRDAPSDARTTGLYVRVMFPNVFSHAGAFARSFALLRKNGFKVIYERGGTTSLGFVLSRIFSIPLVLEADGFIFENQRTFGNHSRLRIGLTKWLESGAYRRADLVVAASESMVEILVNELGVSRDRVRLVRIGADPLPSEPPPESTGANQGHDGRIHLCYSGAIAEWQGLDTIVDAFSRSEPLRANARAVIVGDGYHRRTLMERTHRLGLDDSVIFMGKVPHGEVRRYLLESDSCLAPQIGAKSGPSIKLLEYMAAGKPIVASRILDHSIVEKEHLGLLFDPEDPCDFALKVLELKSNYSAYALGAAVGPSLIRDRYNWKNTADGVLHALEEAASGVWPVVSSDAT